eukprot:3231239-Pleurochrysis_carterae.AAC.1
MFIEAFLHYRSSRIFSYGWTISNKWCHPVATLPGMNGTIHHIRSLSEILRIIAPSPGTNPLCRVLIPTTSRTNSPM